MSLLNIFGRERIGVLSSNNIDDRHILMWDYDDEFTDIKRKNLIMVIEKYELDIFVFQTKRGIHLMDPHLFTFEELFQIQEDLKNILPSDYPTLREVHREDMKSGEEFKGSTLSIDHYKTDFERITTDGTRDVSQGHLDLIKLITKSEHEISGKIINTCVSMVGYRSKK